MSDGAGTTEPLPEHPATGPDFGPLATVPVDLTVEIGPTAATVGDVLALRPGSTLTFDRPISDPVDVMVGGTRLAFAELVFVDDHVGVRITDLPLTDASGGPSDDATDHLAPSDAHAS